MTHRPYYKNAQIGFSLIEMAVVLIIVGLVLGSLLLPLSASIDQQRVNETKQILEEAKQGLIGYALSHSSTDGNGRPYLPCPNTDNTGAEGSRNGAGVCASQEGRLPWASLGLVRGDSWNNLLRYRVHPNFSNSMTGFNLNTIANLRVCDDSGCAAADIIATGLPAVIVSHGKNGYGATRVDGTTNQVDASASLDEQENLDGRDNPRAGNNTPDATDTADVDFVSNIPNANFDDLVTWVSPNVLFTKMVEAGRLP